MPLCRDLFLADKGLFLLYLASWKCSFWWWQGLTRIWL